MKYIQRTTKNITENFCKELLNDRGIIKIDDKEEEKAYFQPTKANLLPCTNLDHMAEAYNLLMKHVESGSSIYIIVDPDVDGYTSSAIFYLYLKDFLQDKFNFKLSYHIPTGKEHGLRCHLLNELLEEKKYDLIVLPDSSSNDFNEHKQLKEMGYDILVIDHHDSDHYSEDAVVINNQLSKNYANKALSGVGVVYKFLKFIDEKRNTPFADFYLDLVALGEISDVMNMNTLENRFICDYGLSHVNNAFFKELLKKQSYSIFGVKTENWDDSYLVLHRPTQTNIAFYITPLINSLIRVGSDVDKENLFKAFINPLEVLESTKLKHEADEVETRSEQMVRCCSNAKSRQNRERDKATELLDIQIEENCLDENKILILNADELDIMNTMTGLCAMGVASKYKKPVMLGKVGPDGFFKGSIRGREESELKDFKGFLKASGLMSYVEGHNNSAGFSMKKSNIDKLYAYANKELENVNFNEGVYETDFVLNGANLDCLSDLIFDINRGSKVWGQGNPEPIVVIKNLKMSANSFNVIGQKKDTIKFEHNSVGFVKFRDTELIKKIRKTGRLLNVTLIGKTSINTWNGIQSPQILVSDMEVESLDNFF